MVQQLLPEDGEVAGLLALMLLIDARRPARTDADGRPDPARRSRIGTCGIRRAIAEGLALLDRRVRARAVGEYQLQAAIAAVHDRAPRRRRDRLAADPRALRPPRADDRQPGRHAQPSGRRGHGGRPRPRGWPSLDEVDERLVGNHRLDAVRAHLLEMAGDTEGASAHYRAAARRTTSLPEQRYLALRAARLERDPAPESARAGLPYSGQDPSSRFTSC